MARLTQADDLSWRIPKKLLERSGQMRLIEIASLINACVCCLSIARAIKKNFSYLALLTVVGEIR